MANECQRDWEGYDSSFEEEDNETGVNIGADNSSLRHPSSKVTRSASDLRLPSSSSTSHSSGLPSKRVIDEVASRTESYKNAFLSLNAYERHKKLVRDYLLYFPASTQLLRRDTTNDKTDSDIIRENHRFLWKSDNDADTWEKQLAKKYHDKLFKEYGICDLTHWSQNKVGIRWRTEEELTVGKGQFICGAKRCQNMEGLRTWEVNFVYIEDSQKKKALVKLRLCCTCSERLNHGTKRKEVTKKPKRRKRKSHSEIPGTKKAKVSDDQSENPQDSSNGEPAETNIWKEPVLIPDSKSRDEEYEEYLDDLLL